MTVDDSPLGSNLPIDLRNVPAATGRAVGCVFVQVEREDCDVAVELKPEADGFVPLNVDPITMNA